jgi:serine/threonine protein kinase
MGEVYEAIDDVLGREVAIKTLKSSGGITAHLLDVRFRQEARAIAQLSHPGIVQVFDIDLSAEPPYLVMERVAGPSLDDRLSRGPLSVAELIPLGIQIARALGAAHAANIVHRDVKPANILSAGPGVWKLADFGVAHVPDSSLTITGQFVGSPAYAPPEALVKGISAPSGDVYGLGATLYEAVAGRWPRLEAKGALLAPVPPLRDLAPHVPAHVAAAIDRAVAFEAANRPTAGDLADLLAHAPHALDTPATPLGSRTTGAAAASVATETLPWHQRWQTWLAGGLILLVIVIVAATRDGSTPARSGAMLPVGANDETPTTIDATPPPSTSGKSAKDWRRIIEELQRGNYSGARRKLDDWERKYGEYPETQRLRSQIDALPQSGEPD